ERDRNAQGGKVTRSDHIARRAAVGSLARRRSFDFDGLGRLAAGEQSKLRVADRAHAWKSLDAIDQLPQCAVGAFPNVAGVAKIDAGEQGAIGREAEI